MRLCCGLVALLVVGCAGSRQVADEEQAYSQWSDHEWRQPSKPFRPGVRWWWPGGAVTDDGIGSELALVDALGFGGIEIQPFTFGLPKERSASPEARSVGTSAFAARVNHAIAQARLRGMRADLTISSGWGLGLALDCAECGTHQLLMTEFDVTGPAEVDRELPRPSSTPYEKHFVPNMLGLVGTFDTDLELVAVVRARLRPNARAGASTASVDELVDVTTHTQGRRLRAVVPQGRHRIFIIYRNLTNTRLAGAAYPGDPARFRTIDHLDARGLAAFQRGYFGPLTAQLRERPDHYFVDSFEFLADLPWTPSFRDRFIKARGYDLLPYVPLLFWKGGDFFFETPTPPRAAFGDVGERVREDYVDVRAQLFDTEFLAPLREMTRAAGARLRLQALGGYSDYLDAFAAVDVPEAEDFGLEGATEFLRLASSAAHVAGRRWTSNEAFVGMSRSSTALSVDDYHRMAGRAFAAGVNQLVSHGRAYPTGDWYPFEGFNITTRLDTTNPVWPQLARLNAAFARMTYAMSRGEASTTVAWLLTEPRPREFDQVIDVGVPAPPVAHGPYREASAVTRTLRTHAVSYDRVSRSAVARSARPCERRACIGAAAYSMILVDNAAIASEDWLGRLRELAAAGVPVVFVGPEARRARGFADAVARDRGVRDTMAQLAQLPSYRHLANADELGPILQRLEEGRSIRPRDPVAWQVATYERSLPSEDLVLFFNGTDADQTPDFEVLRTDVRELVVLDPEDGAAGRRMTHKPREPVRFTVPAGRTRIARLLRSAERHR